MSSNANKPLAMGLVALTVIVFCLAAWVVASQRRLEKMLQLALQQQARAPAAKGPPKALTPAQQFAANQFQPTGRVTAMMTPPTSSIVEVQEFIDEVHLSNVQWKALLAVNNEWMALLRLAQASPDRFPPQMLEGQRQAHDLKLHGALQAVPGAEAKFRALLPKLARNKVTVKGLGGQVYTAAELE